jgi:hypothetical protein
MGPIFVDPNVVEVQGKVMRVLRQRNALSRIKTGSGVLLAPDPDFVFGAIHVARPTFRRFGLIELNGLGRRGAVAKHILMDVDVTRPGQCATPVGVHMHRPEWFGIAANRLKDRALPVRRQVLIAGRPVGENQSDQEICQRLNTLSANQHRTSYLAVRSGTLWPCVYGRAMAGR